LQEDFQQPCDCQERGDPVVCFHHINNSYRDECYCNLFIRIAHSLENSLNGVMCSTISSIAEEIDTKGSRHSQQDMMDCGVITFPWIGT
jgi:hypothetical protein